METKQGITQLPANVEEAKKEFEVACKEAQTLQIANNFTAAFQAVTIVSLLRKALTPEVMAAVFMPLMNTKIGFLTDRSGKPNSRGVVKPPYSVDTVRDCIIDAVTIGLLPTGNQFNIIAERMYPTKEGYTALLRKLGVKYFIEVGYDRADQRNFAEIPCNINYSYNGEKNAFKIIATVKKDDYSSADQLRGKAERRAKKSLYEYITGCDFGDADEESGRVIDAVAEEISSKANTGTVIGKGAAQPTAQPAKDAHPEQPAQQAPSSVKPAQPQPAPQARAGRGTATAKANNIPGF